ncbi:MAG: histidine--tRNA ligase [Pirellulaceae bacterium]|nr:histidine--tRNA ligase [Pirellulaceae bacterium]
MIEPRILSGFRDFLPREMMQRQALMDTARRVYQSFGFAPIDTPTLEYLEILSGKGSAETDRQMYHFVDNGGRPVGMRFDLTVPLARYVAQHINEIGTPFKRYHIAPVWRGERQQRGRYREFVQCDFDTIGTRSLLADLEMILVINQLMMALGFQRFQIRINHRKLLNGLLAQKGLEQHSVGVLRAIDKLGKSGAELVLAELIQVGLPEVVAQEILQLGLYRGDSDGVLELAERAVGDHPLGREGVADLRELIGSAKAAGVPSDRLVLDISIARGLDYYTGTIVETQLLDLPSIGSVCSGGRYDNLARLYTKQDLPGVGASLGLDRLLAAMEDLGMVADRSSPTQILLAFFEPQLQWDYLRLASQLRAIGLNVEFYPEPAKLKKQLKYADQRKIPAVVLIGSQEWEQKQAAVKWLDREVQTTVPLSADGSELREYFRREFFAESVPLNLTNV